MNSRIDPYYHWLGIPKEDQPPNHYRLLGLSLFEDNRDVIAAAADRQMSFVKQYQTGTESSELSQRLLDELMSARLCLLRPETKTEYDRQLRAKTDQDTPREDRGGRWRTDETAPRSVPMKPPPARPTTASPTTAPPTTGPPTIVPPRAAASAMGPSPVASPTAALPIAQPLPAGRRASSAAVSAHEDWPGIAGSHAVVLLVLGACVAGAGLLVGILLFSTLFSGREEQAPADPRTRPADQVATAGRDVSNRVPPPRTRGRPADRSRPGHAEGEDDANSVKDVAGGRGQPIPRGTPGGVGPSSPLPSGTEAAATAATAANADRHSASGGSAATVPTTGLPKDAGTVVSRQPADDPGEPATVADESSATPPAVTAPSMKTPPVMAPNLAELQNPTRQQLQQLVAALTAGCDRIARERAQSQREAKYRALVAGLDDELRQRPILLRYPVTAVRDLDGVADCQLSLGESPELVGVAYEYRNASVRCPASSGSLPRAAEELVYQIQGIPHITLGSYDKARLPQRMQYVCRFRMVEAGSYASLYLQDFSDSLQQFPLTGLGDPRRKWINTTDDLTVRHVQAADWQERKRGSLLPGRMLREIVRTETYVELLDSEPGELTRYYRDRTETQRSGGWAPAASGFWEDMPRDVSSE